MMSKSDHLEMQLSNNNKQIKTDDFGWYLTSQEYFL